MNCPTKIAYFYHVLVQKDVLRLKIAMQNIISMHILYPLTNLLNIFFHNFFRKFADFFQILIQILSKTRLKDKICCLLINKKVIKMDYMRMIHKTLYFYLSDKLRQGVFINSRSVNRFDRVNDIILVAPK